MATRAERFRSDSERTGRGGRRAAKKATKRPAAHPGTHTASKVTYAREIHGTARPSRKSSRASANRAKPDTNFNLREEMVKGSAKSRSQRARARRVRVRGSA